MLWLSLLIVDELPAAHHGVAAGGAARVPCGGFEFAIPLPEIGADRLASLPEHLANFGGLRCRVAGEIEPQDKFGCHRSIAPVDDTARRVALVERIAALWSARRHRPLLRPSRRIEILDRSGGGLRARGESDCFVSLAGLLGQFRTPRWKISGPVKKSGSGVWKHKQNNRGV
jgi:hypothetical protein